MENSARLSCDFKQLTSHESFDTWKFCYQENCGGGDDGRQEIRLIRSVESRKLLQV